MSTSDPLPTRRREQQRSVDTKQAILRTALKEFAERGYEAASMRAIAEQSGLTHQLITYHFLSKEVLWQAVATLVYAELARGREALLQQAKPATAIEQLRQEFIAYFQFTIEQPHLHRFMLQRREGSQSEDRQEWLAQHFLRPHFELVRPLIKSAQKAGDLPKGEPVLLYYAMVSLANTLSIMGPDIEATTEVKAADPKTLKGYMKLMDAMLFATAGKTGKAG
ncbi:TetR/AcrR family transcriptional regulator [Mitsuaria sp. GD03876]|uniref:TetR/AcrR family transcriptional regulator n=1 Tax=Mitsuaria sp. GD03876 TaxID=2975399 RepID=UPI00244B6A91|nr:TetR/AcrR family transcriptional regulator [Mitsuaria sp. GD03876]MDH0865651.1 TetR/AcrR family transcriptional regulator [Mitsuaria sp. GD03876]